MIARNSVFTYKNIPVKLMKVADDLGVRYVVEGSVWHSADRVRVNVQLAEAESGEQLWAGISMTDMLSRFLGEDIGDDFIAFAIVVIGSSQRN